MTSSTSQRSNNKISREVSGEDEEVLEVTTAAAVVIEAVAAEEVRAEVEVAVGVVQPRHKAKQLEYAVMMHVSRS